MSSQTLITQTASMIQTKFQGEGSGHDWWHIYRVWQLSKAIAADEGISDTLVIELGALLHDIADHKFHNGDEEMGGKVSREWLESLDLSPETINEVVHIVDNISFKGGGPNKIKSIDGKIVQDADRLDSIGAIGIARCIAYGAFKGRPIYDPEDKPRLDMSKEEYKSHVGTSINHFYEKLLKLKDLMNTETGKRMAEKRHEYMENFLAEFYAEWDGKA